jgi:hypothetical protein
MTNRPHIVIKNTKEKTYLLIDLAIPEDRNNKENEEEKSYNARIYLFF